MKSNIIYNIAVRIALYVLPFLAACSNPDYPEAPEASDAGLYLNVATMGQSRAGSEGLLANEKMSSLRVIVLHKNGTVEHNKHYTLLNSGEDQKLIFLKVTPNEEKKIFLFSNEESVSSVEGVSGAESKSLTQFFESYQNEADGFETDVNNLYFAPEYSAGKFIPMSAMYTVEMGKGYLDKTFYLVRVATKFTINFKNWRDDYVKINNLSLESHADKNFLMAHVNSYPQSNTYLTWIDWLKAVSDASQPDGYIPSDTGWLKDYALPEQANLNKTFTYNNTPVIVGAPTVDTENPTNSRPGVTENPLVFYIPESKNLKQGEASGGEQEYSLSLSIEGLSEPLSFTLLNLKALFRNTHVVVNLSLYKNEIQFSLSVEPWVKGGTTDIEVTPYTNEVTPQPNNDEN